MARIGRATAYRWLQARFDQLRAQKITLKRCQSLLRLNEKRCQSFERERLTILAKQQRVAAAGQHAALLSSGHISRHFEQLSELEVVRDLYTHFEAV